MASFSKGYFNAPVDVPNGESLVLNGSTSGNVNVTANPTTTSYEMQLPSVIGSATQVLTINSVSGSDKAVLAWSAVSAGSVAADDIATGDADVNITTSTGNITLDAPLNSNIALQVNSANALFLDSSSIQFSQNAVPASSDGAALGTSSLMWSDLFLASAGVINFDNGDMTLTHSANNLTVAGGTLTSSGRVLVDDATDATNTTDGSLQTDGGLSVVKDGVFGNDVKLLSDSAVLSLGADNDATLTHDGTTGLTIAATPISIDSTGSLDLSSTTGDINFQDGGVDQLSLDLDGTAGEVIMQLKVDSDDFVFKQFDGTEVFRVEDNGDFDIAGGAGSSGVTVTSAGQLTADGRVIVDDATEATTTTDGSLQTDGGLSVVKSVVIGNDLSVTANTTVSGNLIQGVTSFIGLGTTQNLWGSGKNTSVKSIYANTAAAFDYFSNTSTTYTTGQLMHIFYTNNSGGTANATVDFGASNLYAGSGTAQFLKFDVSGQSATLIYLGGDAAVQGWRIINTGATVS